MPGGTITVVCEGGGGLLLLKLRQPVSESSNSRSGKRMSGHSQQHESARQLVM
jgi:hypothetical protein